jgi:hypothetical protein
VISTCVLRLVHGPDFGRNNHVLRKNHSAASFGRNLDFGRKLKLEVLCYALHFVITTCPCFFVPALSFFFFFFGRKLEARSAQLEVLCYALHFVITTCVPVFFVPSLFCRQLWKKLGFLS